MLTLVKLFSALNLIALTQPLNFIPLYVKNHKETYFKS